MEALQIQKDEIVKNYVFENKNVRVILINGEPWWVLKDVCNVLEIENHRNVSARLDNDEKGVHQVDTLGGKQELIIVNESGLYSLILRSDKKEAKTFKKWVTSEVLPSIRKTGGYHVLSGEKLIAMAVIEAQKLLEQKEKEIAELKPKAFVYDKISNAEGLKTVQEVAKTIGIGPNVLFSLLRDKGIFYRNNGINLPKQDYIESGYFVTKEEPYQINGQDHVYTRIYVTGKGETWLTNLVHAFNAMDEVDK